MIHTVKNFSKGNEAEVNVFLEFPCFLHDSKDVGSLIFGSSAISKCSLYIWMFSTDILLKPGLKNFVYYFGSMWNECTCSIVWAFFGIAFLWDWNENWSFPVLWPLLSFPAVANISNICWNIESSLLTASTFRIWNSSAGIPSPPLPLFVVMLSKAHLASHSRRSGSRWMTTTSWLSGLLRPFLHVSSLYSCQLFLISFASVRSLLFLSFIVTSLHEIFPLYHQFSWRDR